MRAWMMTVWLCALAVLAAPPALAAAQGPPAFTVEEMLKLKRLSDPQLSPDGTRVAYVLTDVSLEENTRNNDIWVAPVAGGPAVRLAATAASEDRPRWSPDGRQIAFVSTRSGSQQIWIIPAAGGEARQLTSIATGASGLTWSPDGKWLAFVSEVFPQCADEACNERELNALESSKVKARLADGLMYRHWTSWRDGRFSHLFIVPADGSAPPRDLTPGASDVPPFSLGGPEDYAFSPDSREIAFVRKTDRVEAISTNSDVFTLDLTADGAQPRQITAGPGADGGPQYSPDGALLSWRSQARAGFEADIWKLNLLDRKSGSRRILADAWDRSIESWTFTPDSAAVYVTAEESGSVRVYRLDLAGGAPKLVLRDGANGDIQFAPGGASFIFTRASLTAPAEIYKAASDGTRVAAVTNVNGAFLSAFALTPGESVMYAGAGGTPIQAWIVKPNTFKAGVKYPLLCLVHGGPQSAWNDAWTYRWNAQVFASAGYVVFMPNPRGSTGFGQRFTDAISNDWGGKPFDDVMKGVDYAERLPYVDSGRMAAAGASYGGYMMNWFLGHTDRFKAIVSHAGVFNLTSMYGATEELWFPEWDLGGTPWTNPEGYARWSPHTYAKDFKTPTLVTHGELDFRVPVGEALQLFTTLQRQGIPSRLLVFPDEGHWIGKPQNAQRWYNTFLEWIGRWVN
ncbi:MAG TPA: S9 family peptidase [Vicinamibacterales bacterium]|nr:S9 family peptidase [Vicinamibacterales bacterium]HOQ60027.1 S9 family peptidase [Vicinamibacterales bacterium]HPK71125.1 S9 family peptidase [Vicinamibacterales bacterium]